MTQIGLWFVRVFKSSSSPHSLLESNYPTTLHLLRYYLNSDVSVSVVFRIQSLYSCVYDVSCSFVIRAWFWLAREAWMPSAIQSGLVAWIMKTRWNLFVNWFVALAVAATIDMGLPVACLESELLSSAGACAEPSMSHPSYLRAIVEGWSLYYLIRVVYCWWISLCFFVLGR